MVDKRRKSKTLTFLFLLAILRQCSVAMLSRINRLRKKKDFTRIYQQGRSFATPCLWMKTSPNHLENNRLGIVVSRKISKKAVERNLIKRRLRALVKQDLSSLKTGYDIILTARSGILRKSYLELENNLISLLKRSQLLQ